LTVNSIVVPSSLDAPSHVGVTEILILFPTKEVILERIAPLKDGVPKLFVVHPLCPSASLTNSPLNGS